MYKKENRSETIIGFIVVAKSNPATLLSESINRNNKLTNRLENCLLLIKNRKLNGTKTYPAIGK
ncbi:MAG: hypothetical protein ACJAWV_003045 [Flammeovirgaceae bacterium]|jgi:hypothetical protein